MSEGKSSQRCSSCGIFLVDRGSSSFPCPNCGNATIGRCPNCKDQSVKYVCEECSFEGP